MLRRILPYILYAIVVVALITGIVIAFTHSAKTSTTKPQPVYVSHPSTKSQTAGSAAQKTNPSYAAANPPTQSKPTPSPTPPSQPTATPSTTAPNGQPLTNTGPGDTAALFAVVTVGSAAAYSLYQRKKLSV